MSLALDSYQSVENRDNLTAAWERPKHNFSINAMGKTTKNSFTAATLHNVALPLTKYTFSPFDRVLYEVCIPRREAAIQNLSIHDNSARHWLWETLSIKLQITYENDMMKRRPKLSFSNSLFLASCSKLCHDISDAILLFSFACRLNQPSVYTVFLPDVFKFNLHARSWRSINANIADNFTILHSQSPHTLKSIHHQQIIACTLLLHLHIVTIKKSGKIRVGLQ